MHRHHVTIEVRIVACAHKWVDMDRISFDELRIKGLNSLFVKRWCTIEKHRSVINKPLQNIPYDFIFLVDHLFRDPNIRNFLILEQFTNYKRSKHLENHRLRKSTLVERQV